MERNRQRELLAAICDNMRDRLLSRSEHWPEDWDGHELRDLAAMAFERERSNLMSTSLRRRRAFRNALRIAPIL